ncbi:MAG: UDP-N-acetylmuramate dehydrogenase [Syntrophobacteraceae bacterium]|jgi:UDP-N-acetylmuramate dehydrogenase|nr:UDP-N-acetylmuramate dehydrogenase [Syntrophobacteraceae bacterium]
MLRQQGAVPAPSMEPEARSLFWSGLEKRPERDRELEILWDVPLASCTTFGIGGPARCLARPLTMDAVADVLRRVREVEVPFWVLGGGSNVLAPDEPLDGVVLQLSRSCSEIRIRGAGERGCVEVRAGAGLRLSRLIRFGLENGLSGLEPLVGIPGTVGGAAVMNAGTRDGCLADVLLWLDCLDEKGARQRLGLRDLRPGYRTMGLADGWCVVEACLGLRPATRGGMRDRLRETMLKRKATQPLRWPSAGSVYKNPPEAPAGWLIERAGLKGHAVGGAAVSEKHANWIINRGGATAADVRAVMTHVEKSVLEAFGVCLQREILIL